MTDLKAFSLLAEFTEEDREALADLLESRAIPEGRSVFREKSEAEELILIASGTVVVSSMRAREVETFGPGETLGTIALVTVGAREATAKAKSPCEVLVLPRTSFRRLVDDHPRTACRLVEGILRDFAELVRPSLDAVAADPPDA